MNELCERCQRECKNYSGIGVPKASTDRCMGFAPTTNLRGITNQLLKISALKTRTIPSCEPFFISTDLQNFFTQPTNLSDVAEELQAGEDTMNSKEMMMLYMMSQQSKGKEKAGIDPMMMFMMLSKNDKKDGKEKQDLLPLLMMMGQTDTQINPLMMMPMDEDDADTSDLIKKSMLMNMFPDATEAEKVLLAEGKTKAFMLMRMGIKKTEVKENNDCTNCLVTKTRY